MKTDPVILSCVFLCIYPLLFFAVPAYILGRFAGRVRFRSPLEIQGDQPGPPMSAAARAKLPQRGDPKSFGTGPQQ